MPSFYTPKALTFLTLAIHIILIFSRTRFVVCWSISFNKPSKFTSFAPQSYIPSSSCACSTALYQSRKNNGSNRNRPTTNSSNRSISSNNRTENRRTRPQVDQLLASITSPPTFPHSVDPTSVPPGPPHLDPLSPLVETIVHAADMRKASDIIAMRVSSCTATTSFVIVVSGTSRPQNQAIAAAVNKDVMENFDGKRCLGNGTPEGTADSGWILLDYGEVMVHVMTPRSRLFYDIEGQWRERGAEYMDLSGILIGDGPSVSSVGVSTDNDIDVDDWNNSNTGNESKLVPNQAQQQGLEKERFDVEKEIDPFWS